MSNVNYNEKYGWLKKESPTQVKSQITNYLSGEILYQEVLKVRDICSKTNLPSKLASYVSNLPYEIHSNTEKLLKTLGTHPKTARDVDIDAIKSFLAKYPDHNIDLERLDLIIVSLHKGLTNPEDDICKIAFETLKEEQWSYLDTSDKKTKGKLVDVFGVELIELPVTSDLWERRKNTGTKAMMRLYIDGYIGLSWDNSTGGHIKKGSMPANYYILKNQPKAEKYLS